MQGLLWGLVTGDVAGAVSVSLVFELLWLDLIPAGTFIPPNPAAGNLAALSLMTAYGLSGPSDAVFPILLGMPLAWLAAGLERMHRSWQNAGYDTLQGWLAPESREAYAPGMLVRRAVVQAAALYFVFFAVGAGILAMLAGQLLERGLMRPAPETFTWGALWLWASLGGLMSLRVPRAYAVLVCVALAVAVYALLR